MNRPIDNNYISKNRYYELRYFCRQYREWEKEKNEMKIFPDGNFCENFSDPTGETATKLATLNTKIETVDRCIEEVAPEIKEWLKESVTEGKGYNNLIDVPFSKEYFYIRYKAFFSRLNQTV